MNKPNTAAAILNPNHAFLVGLPKKSKYQFFVRTTTRSAVAQVIRTELPTVATGKKETDIRDPEKAGGYVLPSGVQMGCCCGAGAWRAVTDDQSS